MKKLAILFTLTVVLSTTLFAQQNFIPRGKITFEKKVNMVRTFEENEWMNDDFKDKMQKYQTSLWDYSFNQTHSLYKQAPRNMSSNSMFFFDSGSATAQLYTDFDNNNRVLNKNISGVNYLLKDTIPKLEWKIQQDVRIIAGYEARKATAIFNDTVTVVAFYTDQILAQGGPEGFTGLPGMILGLAIPRYFTTWFATKVEIVPETALNIVVPSKGEKAETERDYKKMVDVYLRWMDDKIKYTPEDIRRQIYSLTL